VLGRRMHDRASQHFGLPSTNAWPKYLEATSACGGAYDIRFSG
jgi:hypothetical protein